jgi:hypothetical protein
VAAPSPTTLDFWKRHGDLPARTVVLPHAQLKPRGPGAAAGARTGLPPRLPGRADAAQGLAAVPRAGRAAGRRPALRFHHLGARPDPATPATFHPVRATPGQPQAMQDAAEALELDAALIWPLCRETFSFTAYEAAAAGAAVITGPDSGNVAAFVAASGLGRVLDDEAALIEAFLRRDPGPGARAGPRPCYDLAYSGLTGDLVAASGAR